MCLAAWRGRACMVLRRARGSPGIRTRVLACPAMTHRRPVAGHGATPSIESPRKPGHGRGRTGTRRSRHRMTRLSSSGLAEGAVFVPGDVTAIGAPEIEHDAGIRPAFRLAQVLFHQATNVLGEGHAEFSRPPSRLPVDLWIERNLGTRCHDGNSIQHTFSWATAPSDPGGSGMRDCGPGAVVDGCEEPRLMWCTT